MSKIIKITEQHILYEDKVNPNEPLPIIIKAKRAKWGLGAKAIPQMMGIDYDVFKGKCSGNRPATRDFVIAVCALMLMDSCETDEALRSHKNKFPAFDEVNDRDFCIVHFLDNPEYSYPTSDILTKLNAALAAEDYGY